MSNTLSEFLGAVRKHVASVEGANAAVPQVFLDAMNKIGESVESWANELHLIESKKVGGRTVMAAAESFTADMIPTAIGPERILDLCKECKVSNEHLATACERVAQVLFATMGRKHGEAFTEFNQPSAGMEGNVLPLDTIFPTNIVQTLTSSPSLETFGINMDRVEPDLKTILTVALLQFHTNLTPRIVPIKTISQGNVTIVRESMEVFDMSSDDAQKPTRVIELYRDPSMVTTRATRIVPLWKNDSTTDAKLADEGVYKFEKDINLFDLALSSKIGYEKYNHTDFVEDGILLDGVLLKFTNTPTSGDATTFYAMVSIPAARGRLTQITNDLSSTDRRLSLDRFSVRLFKSNASAYVVKAVTTSGHTAPTMTSTSGFFDSLTNGKYIKIDMHVNAHVDRKVAKADATCWCKASLVGADSDATTTSWFNQITVEPVGFTLDARYNEDNKRKTAIRIATRRRSMSYELPTGRNFVSDSAIGQDGALNAAGHLAQCEHIGRDFNNLSIITETMQAVHDQCMGINNDAESQAQLALSYAAGDQVNPYVYMDSLDMTGLYGLRAADASGDVKQFVRTYFNQLTSALLGKTFYQQQLADGATVTFRCITSNNLMGNLFQVKHIHAHLDQDSAGTGGVEHVTVLDNGVRLELVTTTFDSMANRIILIPYLSGSQDSIFNFGTDFDQGTLVGAVTIGTDGGASYHRLFSTTRELLIPTNVIGAIIDVTGTDTVNMSDATSSLPILWKETCDVSTHAHS